MRAVAAAAVLTLTSCATILRGPNETFSVASRPEGAAATITCASGIRVTDTTPARLTIPRKADGCSLTIDRPGFRPKLIAIDRGVSGAFWVNFATIGAASMGVLLAEPSDASLPAAWAAGAVAATGFLIDRLTGAAFSHDPIEVEVELETAH